MGQCTFILFWFFYYQDKILGVMCIRNLTSQGHIDFILAIAGLMKLRAGALPEVVFLLHRKIIRQEI